jgi:excinuclease ABC subunit C
MLRLVERFFPIRVCRAGSGNGQWAKRPCVRYELGRCPGLCGPCGPFGVQGEGGRYSAAPEGPVSRSCRKTPSEDGQASALMDFETAARMRDTIRALWKLSRKHVSMVFSEPLDGGTWKSLLQLQDLLSLPAIPGGSRGLTYPISPEVRPTGFVWSSSRECPTRPCTGDTGSGQLRGG